MAGQKLVEVLSGGAVIPVIRTMEDYTYALAKATAPSLMLLFGDIVSLPKLLAQARQQRKRVIVHIDLLEGIAKDKTGIKFLASLGVAVIVTTRSQLVRSAREEGMIAIQRLFLVDSESVKIGLQLLKHCKPDIVEIMPVHTPAAIVQQIVDEYGLPAMAGGFLTSTEGIKSALNNGIHAVSSSSRELWAGCCKTLVGF